MRDSCHSDSLIENLLVMHFQNLAYKSLKLIVKMSRNFRVEFYVLWYSTGERYLFRSLTPDQCSILFTIVTLITVDKPSFVPIQPKNTRHHGPRNFCQH
jgi:hypothetical protein